MLTKYDIMLIAGSTIDGSDKCGSESERLHHEQMVADFRAELNIGYQESFGYITCELTEEQYEKYKYDARIYSIEPSCIPNTCSERFTVRDTTTNNQWHLRQLSGRVRNETTITTGFKFELGTTKYGVNDTDFQLVYDRLYLTTTTNMFIHKGKVYNYVASVNELVMQLPRPSNTTVIYQQNVDLFVVYDELKYSLVLRNPDKVAETDIVLYSVKIKLNTSSLVTFYAMSQFGFSDAHLGTLEYYDLKIADPLYNQYVTATCGANVNIIIGDTQLKYSNADFGTRAKFIGNAYAGTYYTEYGAQDSTNDLIDNHGTAVGLAAGGTICGIASKCNILGYTLLDISTDRGNKSNRVLEGLDEIYTYIRNKKLVGPFPVVLNLSLGTDWGIVSAAQDNAIAALIALGVTVVIAAGNDGKVHNSSPYHKDAILVGASTELITPCDFSNYGQRISIYAPGADIYSTLTGSWSRWQGTSVAAPHIAGLCALFLSVYPKATPAEVKAAVLGNAIAAITYNKDATTYAFAQHPYYGYIDKSSITTAEVLERLIYTVRPYAVGYDGERVYSETIELTLNSIGSAIVSAGKSETIDLATAIKLVP